jgi:pilus assembly protein CpaF
MVEQKKIMLKVCVVDEENQRKNHIFDPDKTREIKIGRSGSGEIILASPTISRLHAKMILADGAVSVQNHSPNGTYVNDHRIDRLTRLSEDDTVHIGNFSFTVQIGDKAQVEAKPASQPAKTVKKTPAKDAPRGDSDELVNLKRKIHNSLLKYFDLRSLNLGKIGDEDLRERTRVVLEEILDEMSGEVKRLSSREVLLKDLLDEFLQLGPLEDLLDDPDVSEIMVVSKDRIFIEKGGKLTLSEKRFTTDDAVHNIIQRIVTPIGRRIDESSPLVDARLKDGSRVNAIIPPLALKGPCITIRKFSKIPLTTEDLIKFGTLNELMRNFLQKCIAGRKNVLISGGTGSGKTTLLNILCSYIPENERIVTIEDAAELQLLQEHVVSLEARPKNIEGTGEISIRDLVKNALRMRPDRIIVGECRSGEALDMLQAMNTGHDGSLTTGHANSPRDMIGRLETMVLFGGVDLPVRAIREQIVSAIDLIVQQERMLDGKRKITYISEVTGIDDSGQIETEDIFLFQRKGLTPEGDVIGDFITTGYIPSFTQEFIERGVISTGELF